MFAASQCAASDDLGMGRNDEWRSVPVDRVRLNGPLGRRIALTATNNLMKIDIEKDFFGPFRNKTAKEGFIGLGKLLDGAAYLAKYTGLPEVIERKREIARALADTQDADGYIGYFAQESRMSKLWDLHEIGFILQGLVSDWELFGERRSLDAARKVSDYAINNPNMPADGVPYWDFGAPGEERDSSAASIMASGLLELAGFVGGEKGASYRAFAVKQLLSLASDEYFSKGDEIGHFLLKHGVGAKPSGSEVDTPLDYGDYYFLEALMRFEKDERAVH